MTIQSSNIEIGLIVRHQRNSGVFWVTEITSSGGVTLSLADFTNSRTISQRVLMNGYQKLSEDGFHAQKFLDPELVYSWVHNAPLKLLSAILRDCDSFEATEKDFKDLLYAGPKESPVRVIKDITWNNWWGRATELLRENQSHIRSRGNRWSLTKNAAPVPEIPLPTPPPKLAAIVSPIPDLEPLSVNVTSVIAGDTSFKDLNDNQRQNVTRRLLGDGIWWWFKTPEGIAQVVQYDRSLAELLKYLAQPDCPKHHRELFADIIPKLYSRGAAGKLKKVLEALENLLSGHDNGFSGFCSFSHRLVPILAQTSLRIRNDKDRDASSAVVAEVAIAKLINSWLSCGDEMKTYLEHYDFLASDLKEMVQLGYLDLAKTQELARVNTSGPRMSDLIRTFIEEWESDHAISESREPSTSDQAHNEIVSTLVSSVLSTVKDDIRIPLTLKLVTSSATRKGVVNFLTQAKITPDTVNFLLCCVRQASVDPDLESLQGISVVASAFCENLDESYSEQIVKLWMGIVAGGIEVTDSLESKMESQISRQVAGSEETYHRGASPLNQVLHVFGVEARKRQRAAENRARRELLKSQEDQEQLRHKIEAAEAELKSSKQLVERVRSGHRIPERLAEFYGKTAILEPVADYLQQLIIYETESSNHHDRSSNVVTRLTDILAVKGVRKVQENGEISEYEPTLHQFAPDSSTFNSTVVIVCPGFSLEDPEGNEVVLKRAIVRSVD